ncbi:hypothetical protein QTP86_031805 [Hemibagrus guttatus]|nr:hypothetical protein QTP86_031805 [Hemibagrus guttatus]
MKGQIVMARPLDQNISKTAALVGCSRSAVSACASLTWGTHGTRMHYGKKVCRRRQCPALDNVLLGNLGSCRPCGCYWDT